MPVNTPITVAYGDGIGPEIMEAALFVLDKACAKLDIDVIEIGEKVYLRGVTSGMEPSAFDSLRRTRVFLKAPVTTPQGSGYTSLNVTTRKTFGLYANVRPCMSYHPFIATKHPRMDVVIIRENEEDLYAGIEHRQTAQVCQCLKLISRPGCEKIARYAFEYAAANNRRKVSCFTKDNIMKMTDGLFHKVFDEIAAEYPSIASEHWIVDIGAAMLADTPENFDVIVMPNLYGDILSDVAAQITGSVGLGGSANIGDSCAMFEAIHGSAPRIAGRNEANPSGLILASVLMLNHIGQSGTATRIHNAWLRAIEDGIHTADMYKQGTSREKAGTREFAQAVVERLGENPRALKAADYAAEQPRQVKPPPTAQQPEVSKELTGVDVFLCWDKGSAAQLGGALTSAGTPALRLRTISNRGQNVWPHTSPDTFCTDHWRARFTRETGTGKLEYADIIALLDNVTRAGYEIIKTENLYDFDGIPGFTG
ncbi:MAG: NADP-dependent isocitrate dehydrogenase [Candidatus Sumerlaeota bacterium]|nr:NADP-dependent isocitrate dehydrogenase [Candidatus Sumerlaeota bacterium]